jgi:hypothetical protein
MTALLIAGIGVLAPSSASAGEPVLFLGTAGVGDPSVDGSSDQVPRLRLSYVGAAADGVEVRVPAEGFVAPDSWKREPQKAPYRLAGPANGVLVEDGDKRILQLEVPVEVSIWKDGVAVVYDVIATADVPKAGDEKGPVQIHYQATPRNPPEGRSREPVTGTLQGWFDESF